MLEYVVLAVVEGGGALTETSLMSALVMQASSVALAQHGSKMSLEDGMVHGKGRKEPVRYKRRRWKVRRAKQMPV